MVCCKVIVKLLPFIKTQLPVKSEHPGKTQISSSENTLFSIGALKEFVQKLTKDQISENDPRTLVSSFCDLGKFREAVGVDTERKKTFNSKLK